MPGRDDYRLRLRSSSCDGIVRQLYVRVDGRLIGVGEVCTGCAEVSLSERVLRELVERPVARVRGFRTQDDPVGPRVASGADG